MREVKKIAPFISFRWWLLHTIGITVIYTVGHLVFGA
jgi:hypothetical protein